MRTVDPSELIFTDVAPPSDDSTASATVDAFGGAAPTGEQAQEPPAGVTLPPETPRGSMRATLRRLGVASMDNTDDEQAMREALLKALSTASIRVLRGLLFERGWRCPGCNEKTQFVQAVVESLVQPLVARHALPLFLYDSPLFPQTSSHLHLFEPRYKLLCRKALKADRYFGFVVGGVGTLAKVTRHRFTDDDAADGSCHLTVAGSRRFRLHTQWEEQCASGPPHKVHCHTVHLPLGALLYTSGPVCGTGALGARADRCAMQTWCTSTTRSRRSPRRRGRRRAGPHMAYHHTVQPPLHSVHC